MFMTLNCYFGTSPSKKNLIIEFFNFFLTCFKIFRLATQPEPPAPKWGDLEPEPPNGGRHPNPGYSCIDKRVQHRGQVAPGMRL